MSVTFWMPQAPQVRIEPYPEDEPGYFEEVPVAPFTEVNMTNANAAALLALLGQYTEDLCGEWAGAKLDSVHRKVMILLNTTPERFMEDHYVQGNFISSGRDMDYVTRRLTDMLHLLTVAKRYGFRVSYG